MGLNEAASAPSKENLIWRPYLCPKTNFQASIRESWMIEPTSATVSDRADLGDRLWRKYSPAVDGFVLTQGSLSGVALRDVPYAHLMAPRRACEAKAAEFPGGICAATGPETRQGTSRGTRHGTRHGTCQGTRQGVLGKHNKSSLSTVAASHHSPLSLRHHSSLDRRVQEILKEWDCAEREREFARKGASTVPWYQLAQAISHWG
jgi:hypothetical protein